jgi:hypothetical protein
MAARFAHFAGALESPTVTAAQSLRWAALCRNRY